MLTVEALRDRFYPREGSGRRCRDGAVEFYERLRRAENADHAVVLNLGAGAIMDPDRRMRGVFKKLVGADIDPAVASNPDLDEAVVTDGVRLPFADETFDIVYSDWTMEHVADPPRLVGEVQRVLKPGGLFTFRTPNLLHYVSLLAQATPHSFHRFLAQRLRSSLLPEPWPTLYRLNTPRRIRRVLRGAGFVHVETTSIEPEPSYLVFNSLAFLGGVAYERLVSGHRLLAPFRHVILAQACRQAGPRSSK